MFSLKRLFPLALGLSLALVALSATPATRAADNDVTFEIVGAPLSASVAAVTLDDITSSYDQQIPTGNMTLSVIDPTGLGNGWNVTILSSTLVYTGTANTKTNLTADKFAINTPGTPTMVAGMAVENTAGHGPFVGVGGTLDTARKVILSAADHGLGSYTQNLPISLTVPAYTRAGNYAGTLTVTISAGPNT
ncbi:MAG: hypothetical protein WCK70_07560 [Chloroflexales bacterium]|jgi:hypothetical protein